MSQPLRGEEEQAARESSRILQGEWGYTVRLGSGSWEYAKPRPGWGPLRSAVNFGFMASGVCDGACLGMIVFLAHGSFTELRESLS